MVKQLFEEQRRYLNRFFDQVDASQVQKVVDLLCDCKGVVVFSGVGKSGHIAEKLVATFLSTGTRSFFLSPANALHGDIGFLSTEDVFIALSKSGGSQELLDLMPHVRKRGAYTIAVVSSPRSQLAAVADLTILLPVEREICPYDLAPTTSTAAQLIFGDCLAVALMKKKQFSVTDFASNHPGGLLGRKITLQVADLMLKGRQIPLCRPTDKLIDVIHELSEKRCGCLLVADERKQLKGIFTDGDLRRALQSKGAAVLQTPLSDLMTLSPKCIAPERLAVEAVRMMEEDSARLITVLPVVEQGSVIGLLRMHDILQKELS